MENFADDRARLWALLGYWCVSLLTAYVIYGSTLRSVEQLLTIGCHVCRHTDDEANAPLHTSATWSGSFILNFLRWFVFDIPGVANSVHVRISMALRSDELGAVKIAIRSELQTLAIVVRTAMHIDANSKGCQVQCRYCSLPFQLTNYAR